MNILRWISFIPCAILAYIVGFMAWFFITKYSIGVFIYNIGSDGVIHDILKIISNAPAVYIGSVFGVYVAPSNKKTAEIIVLSTFILLATLSIIFGNLYYSNTSTSIISSIVMISMSIFLISQNINNKKYEDI